MITVRNRLQYPPRNTPYDPMDIHLKALGCRLNEAELEQWSQEFQALGHRVARQQSDADLIVLNTCAVTGDAARKSRNLINRFHRECPEAKLVVSGCHASLDPEGVAKTLGVDLVVTNEHKDELVPRIMRELDLNSMPEMATEPGDSSLFPMGRHRAFLKIQDGCRYRCTFCIVTVARGEERSRSIRELVEETNRIHASGINEIVLTGVHVGGYGSDLDVSLRDLVQALLEDTDIPRIRFASVEPWDLPEGFFGLFRNPRLMPHMHLPLQSGSDAILRRMARRCKTDEFRSLIQRARAEVPGFNVTSDVIVGFPGETQEDWSNTLAFVEEIGFGHLHIFSYSPREGTRAAGLPGQVPGNIRKQRSRELHQLAEKMKRAALEEQLGTPTEVLWESVYADAAGRSFAEGYSRNYFRVRAEVDNNQEWEHRISPVSITSVENGCLVSRLV